jgi:hypothetical protein
VPARDDGVDEGPVDGDVADRVVDGQHGGDEVPAEPALGVEGSERDGAERSAGGPTARSR